jgi:hypothetical protein
MEKKDANYGVTMGHIKVAETGRERLKQDKKIRRWGSKEEKWERSGTGVREEKGREEGKRWEE